MNNFYEARRDNDDNTVDFFTSVGAMAHFHSAIEILICKTGEIDITINGVPDTLHGGEILVCNSYDVHAYFMKSFNKNAVIIIPKNLLKNYFTINGNRKFQSNIIRNEECYKQLVTLLSCMFYYKGKKPADDLIFTNLGQAIFALASSYLTLTDKPINKDTMKDVLFYIYDNYTDEIDLNTIAKQFGYTPNHFSYIFNSYMHINLATFINNLRTEKSAELIKNGASIIEASENSGFQSLRTFYRCFKKKYGVSPKNFVGGS